MQPDPYEEILAADERLADLAASDPMMQEVDAEDKATAEAELMGTLAAALPLIKTDGALKMDARQQFQKGLEMRLATP